MIIVFNVKICALDLDYDKHAEITLLPSAEQANCNTDVNLDNEDEPTGLISHLPGRVLRAGGSGAVVGGKLTR